MNKYKANEGTDLETYTRLAALEKNICFRPFAVDYARTDGKPVKEKLECTFFGCVCRDAYQDPGIRCGDYKVRFLCPCSRTQENFAYSKLFFMSFNLSLIDNFYFLLYHWFLHDSILHLAHRYHRESIRGA